MHHRSNVKYHPGLEPLEQKQLLSAGASAHPVESLPSSSRALSSSHPADASVTAGADIARAQNAPAGQTVTADDQKPTHGYLLFRITNPSGFDNTLRPPFQQVLVQPNLPIPGQVYNILSITVRNGTAKTFTADSGFYVRFPTSGYTTPILTGNQEWKPGQRIVFYVLTKKYYPLPSEQHSGFIFDLGGARSVGIPGPSAIALRIKYNPATFSRTLDSIVAFGPGNQGGRGAFFGLPNTSINQYVFALTRRNDFAGYF